MPLPLISIIIPCYNHGIYLDEAIASIHLEKYAGRFEVILVNDGSTDAFTNQKVQEIALRGDIKVINQKNQGLAKARNNAIAAAAGDFILPLDSDNHLVPEVFLEALDVMLNDEDIWAVYTDAIRFGDRNDYWAVGAPDAYQLCHLNYIDACALIRKKVFDAFPYDPQMPGMGNEDWELWVRIILSGKQLHYLAKPGFEYRWVHAGSMSINSTIPKYNLNKQYIFNKHFAAMSRLYLASFFGAKGDMSYKKRFRHYYHTVLLAKLGIRKMKV